jgi:hypothetical protein
MEKKYLRQNIYSKTKKCHDPKPKNSTSEASIDIECVQTLQMQFVFHYLNFNPVGKHWQQAKCRALKLELKQSVKSDMEI